jgi:catechol 2,3-dioxygenase-like lactoylglutathione lyase family enzyme
MRLSLQNTLVGRRQSASGNPLHIGHATRKGHGRVGAVRLRIRVAALLFAFAAICAVTAHNQLALARPPRAAHAVRSLPANGMVAVESVGMTVSDIDRSVDFFTRVLSFEKVSDVEVAGDEYEHLEGLFGLRMRVVRLKLGDESIDLTEYLTPRGRPIPVDSRSNDHWFQHVAIITTDMDRAYQWLRMNRVQHASTGPQRLPETIKAAAGIKAFYFKDPDGHSLEVLQFPADKGSGKWHQPTDKLFLGIDHTAIVVSDTETSLGFYRDVLGMTVAGESENFGTEQEHLNNVFGARLRITALRGASGPGIEFLEYRAPRDGRPVPADERPNDLIHWQTTLLTTDASAMAGRVRTRKLRFVSSGLIQMTDATLGFSKGFLVRDPDGHVMQIVEK